MDEVIDVLQLYINNACAHCTHIITIYKYLMTLEL